MKKLMPLFLLLTACAFAFEKPMLEGSVDIQYFGEAMGQAIDYLPKPEFESNYYTSFQSMAGSDAVLSLHNQGENESLVEIKAFGDEGILRFMVKLSPDEEMRFDLYEIGEMSALCLTSLAPFQAVVYDFSQERKTALECTERTYGSTEELKRIKAELEKAGGTPSPGSKTCGGYWTLSSSSFSKSSTGSVTYYFSPGYIRWGNNSAIGSWRTVGVDGNGNSCQASWYPDAAQKCPWGSVDCLGNFYNVYGTFPY